MRSAAAAPSAKPLLSENTEDATEQQRQDSTPKKIRRSRRGPSDGVIFSNDDQEVGGQLQFIRSRVTMAV